MKAYSQEEVLKRYSSGPILLLMRRVFTVIVTFASTITIARLLTPRDYGLAAMSIVIMSFMQIFRDFGMSNALMRKGAIDTREVSFMFWFNVAATIVIAAVIAIASPAFALFYREPAVVDIILVSLIGFIIEGVCLQHAAILKRDLRFGVIATAETAGIAIGFVTGLTLAYYLRNVWAIVIMGLVQSAVTSLIMVFKADWHPGRYKKPDSLKELIVFGANASAFSILNFFSRNASTFAIGHFMAPASLGLFNRAFALYQMPLNNLIQPLAQAALPVMARLRSSPDIYRTTYCKLVRTICCAVGPAGAILIFASNPLIIALLGQKWAEAGPVLAALSASLIIYGLVWPIGDLLITQNRSHELRTAGIYDFVLRVGGATIGAYFGLFWAAAGVTIGLLATVPIRVWQSGRTGPVSAGDQYRAFASSVPLSASGLGGSYLGLMAGNALGYAAGGQALSSLICGMVLTIAGGCLFSSSRAAMIETISTFGGGRFLSLANRITAKEMKA